MPAERYFVDAILKANDEIQIADQEFHHLKHVMRTRKGDFVELVNGKGALANATVTDILKDKAILKIESAAQAAKPQNQIILAQAIPKPNRLDYILEKGTELGTDAFWLFPSTHSVKKEFSPNQEVRMRTQVITAMKQCGRLFLPEIILKPPIEKWDPFSEGAFFGDVDPQATLFWEIWQNYKVGKTVVFCIGPESGFTEEEEELLREKGAMGVKLHENILRTDTAPLVALSLMKHWLLSDTG